LQEAQATANSHRFDDLLYQRLNATLAEYLKALEEI
jgi:primosomal protein N''